MQEADCLFRTGYYNVSYPLGCCIGCAGKKAWNELMSEYKYFRNERTAIRPRE